MQTNGKTPDRFCILCTLMFPVEHPKVACVFWLPAAQRGSPGNLCRHATILLSKSESTGWRRSVTRWNAYVVVRRQEFSWFSSPFLSYGRTAAQPYIFKRFLANLKPFCRDLYIDLVFRLQDHAWFAVSISLNHPKQFRLGDVYGGNIKWRLMVCFVAKQNIFLNAKDPHVSFSVHVASDPTTDLGPGAGVSLNGDGGGKSFVQCFLHS